MSETSPDAILGGVERVWDLFLFLLGAAFVTLGVMNPSTAPLWVALALLVAVFLALHWQRRRLGGVLVRAGVRLAGRGEGPPRAAGDPTTGDAPLRGEIKPRGELSLTVIRGAPSPGLSAEEALTGWEHDRARLRRAVDIAITWLYRRANWSGLSPDGRFVEPAPADIWAKDKYKQLDLEPLPYEPPQHVAHEPGWEPPPDRFERVENIVASTSPENKLRPPKAADIPVEAWRVARPHFCQYVADLVRTGRKLRDDLYGIPTTAVPDDDLRWRELVDAWVDALGDFMRDYYDSGVTFGNGAAALPPAWRQKHVETVTARLRWLEGQQQELACDKSDGDVPAASKPAAKSPDVAESPPAIESLPQGWRQLRERRVRDGRLILAEHQRVAEMGVKRLVMEQWALWHVSRAGPTVLRYFDDSQTAVAAFESRDDDAQVSGR